MDAPLLVASLVAASFTMGFGVEVLVWIVFYKDIASPPSKITRRAHVCALLPLPSF